VKRFELADPFALTADTRAYIPREATERVLAALLYAIDERHRPAALTGPSGLGKTLLLHVLSERARGNWHPVYLPYASLAPEELCAWVLSVLGEESSGEAWPELRAQLRILRAHGAGLLLLVDDADTMPLDTVRWLGEQAAEGEGLGIVLAASDGVASGRVVAALGERVELTRFSQPMSEAESVDYVAWRLARAGVPPAVRSHFDPATVRSLHGVAGGNPRRLHIAAASVLRGGPAELPEDGFERDGDLAHEDASPAAPAAEDRPED
jgi:type II secretory pathway predicted ATPase ExeA